MPRACVRAAWGCLYTCHQVTTDSWYEVVCHALRLALQETERLVSDPVPGITATADPKNDRYFHVTINGPTNV